ncbi:MAG: ABC transporter permease [Clostridiaceae bacterium]
MQVFKVSLKILKKNIPSLMIYLIVFLVLSVIFSSVAKEQESEYSDFETVKTSVAFFQEESTPLVEAFKNELAKSATFVETKDDYDTIMDALYFRSVTYVIRIPKGFTEKIMNGQDVQLEKRTVAGSISNTYTDLAINNYFNTARLYISQEPNLTQEELANKVSLSLAHRTDITVQKGSISNDSFGYGKFFFNYLAYSLVSILITGTSIVMIVWKNQELYRRTEVSPLKRDTINMGKVLALALFTVITWFILVIAYFFLSGNFAFNTQLLLYIANSFVFAFMALWLSYLIGTLLKSRNAISAASNVLSLGPSFISGVFVPQDLLGQNVLSIAKFTPTYWYVTANNMIDAMTETNSDTIMQIFSNTAVVFGFGVVFLIIALILGRRRQFT